MDERSEKKMKESPGDSTAIEEGLMARFGEESEVVDTFRTYVNYGTCTKVARLIALHSYYGLEVYKAESVIK